MQVLEKKVTLESGRKITVYTMQNHKGMCVEVLSLGATLTKIITADRNGKFENVILRWKDINHYEEHPGNFGAVIGRVAGRICKGQVTLDGIRYQFPKNTFENTLHGGINGFHKKNWEGSIFKTDKEAAVKLTYLSKDGEEGFPGNLNVQVTYRLSDQNQLSIEFSAQTDKETIVNLTNHAYFNLSGDAKRDILDEEVYINSSYIYEIDKELIPTGRMIAVKDDPCFDFLTPKKLGRDIGKDNIQLKYAGGYDHIWELEKGEAAAILYDRQSGRKMTITTDAPDVVMYTMNYASEPYELECGKCQKPRFAVCFETQKPAIGHNELNKEKIILKPGENYSQKTKLTFEVE